jgi:hypothetical protein
MIHRSSSSRLIALVFIVVLFATSCIKTSYVELGKDEPNLMGSKRMVGVQVDRSFLDEIPECTVILQPSAEPQLRKFSPIVEEALGRHLTLKLTRVIDAIERRHMARQSSLDLRLHEDQIELAADTGCDTLLMTRIVGPGKTYMVVWSQMQIGIEITMTRARDRKMLWRARHIADRSEGGIPFSPIGIVVDAYSSARFSSDREISESVIDDAIRRIVRAIPNSRRINVNPLPSNYLSAVTIPPPGNR